MRETRPDPEHSGPIGLKTLHSHLGYLLSVDYEIVFLKDSKRLLKCAQSIRTGAIYVWKKNT